MVFRVESRPGACARKSNSKYPFPFETVSVVGILKIVDCAIAVCAVTTNKRATNNPERTLNLFTVFTRLSSFSAKKNAQQHQHRVQTGTSSSSEFFAAQLRAARDTFVTQQARGCQTNTFSLELPSEHKNPSLCAK